MAIVFELVADFGKDAQSAHDFLGSISTRAAPIVIDGAIIELHPPHIVAPSIEEALLAKGYAMQRTFEVGLLPVLVSLGLAMDPKKGVRHRLNEAQISQLGSKLYERLRGSPGFDLAWVGWERLVPTLDELTELSAQDLQHYAGLVVNRKYHSLVTAPELLEDFDELHEWIPYRGSPDNL